jgi:hypothetical protein
MISHISQRFDTGVRKFAHPLYRDAPLVGGVRTPALTE